MSDNKRVKKRLIKKYGDECFIEKLHLRHDTEPRVYKSKGQMEKMKRLTYHHMIPKSKGGKATDENGAILSEENHIWFHQQSPEVQEELNQKFREYKKCKVELTDDLDLDFSVNTIVFEPQEIFKERRTRKKEIAEKKAKKYEDKEFIRLKKEYEDR